MKTAITLLLLSLNLLVQAQFSISADSIYVDVDAGEDYGTVDIQNDSIGGNILWVLTTACEPENWTHYVMDMDINYIPGIDSLGFALGAHETGLLRVFLLLSEPPGVAKYTMEIWEEGNRENNKFVRFFFNGTDCQLTNSDDPVTQKQAIVYPNPFTDKLIIGITTGSIAEVFDLLGRRVYRQEIKTGSVNEIDLSELSTGNYFVAIKAVNGSVIEVMPVAKSSTR
jgi:hypothetical protein